MQSITGEKAMTGEEGSGARGSQAVPAATPANEPGSLLHQLNQPLTAINTYAEAGLQLIDSGRGDAGRLRELFEKIAHQSSRTFDISQQMKSALRDSRGQE